MSRRLLDWLEERTGVESAVRHFLEEEIPASSGWHQVFGSVALFLFLVQAFTGILLSLNYAPAPGDAYNSVKYIVTEVSGGRLIHGLHHWGASMMIVVVVLHMAQVFLYGAYKKPRETTWIAGVFLLLLVLAFGLTGYLLPWDNRAYWGTVVTTQIASKAPLAGGYLTRLLASQDGIGVVAFARFYTAHVLLLPLLTVMLMAVHVYLVRRHGAAPVPGDSGPKKPFFPGQVFKDTMAIFAAFAILFGMALFAHVPLGRLADPTDTTYIPRPEWYFLFLFQTLKFFEGPLEIVGTVVLPTLAILALLLAPFLDRDTVTRPAQRTVAGGIVLLAVIGWAGLTVAAVVTTPKAREPASADGPQDWQQLSPEELAGIGYFRLENCASCHSLGEGDSKVGPDLTTTAIRRTAAWMIEHFKHPQQLMPGSSMPAIRLKNSELNALAAFLLKLTPHNAAALQSAPEFAVAGAMIFQANQCSVCHHVNGVGMKTGPPLNGLSGRRSREWVAGHFLDPQQHSPGTIMPAYKFSAKDMDRIVAYLMSIPD